jgi:hypothetical protein
MRWHDIYKSSRSLMLSLTTCKLVAINFKMEKVLYQHQKILVILGEYVRQRNTTSLKTPQMQACRQKDKASERASQQKHIQACYVPANRLVSQPTSHPQVAARNHSRRSSKHWNSALQRCRGEASMGEQVVGEEADVGKSFLSFPLLPPLLTRWQGRGWKTSLQGGCPTQRWCAFIMFLTRWEGA